MAQWGRQSQPYQAFKHYCEGKQCFFKYWFIKLVFELLCLAVFSSNVPVLSSVYPLYSSLKSGFCLHCHHTVALLKVASNHFPAHISLPLLTTLSEASLTLGLTKVTLRFPLPLPFSAPSFSSCPLAGSFLSHGLILIHQLLGHLSLCKGHIYGLGPHLNSTPGFYLAQRCF